MAKERKKSLKIKRSLKDNYILYVEGKTEKEYFEHIKLRSRFDNVSFKIKKGKEEDFIENCSDEVPHLIILDIDDVSKKNDKSKRYENIFKIVNGDYKDRVFFNNYSFETFLLLHIAPFTRVITKPNQYNPYMKRYFDLKDSWSENKNEKNRKLVFSKINEKSIETARKNLSQLSNEPFKNPSSNMDKFFEYIERKQKSNKATKHKC